MTAYPLKGSRVVVQAKYFRSSIGVRVLARSGESQMLFACFDLHQRIVQHATKGYARINVHIVFRAPNAFLARHEQAGIPRAGRAQDEI